ncbi:hypothetical protein DBR47_17745 [Paucibacter sp. KBW04]|uniref:hypothetical protein n=1 Tax=Paucibacter sp. KBW04 TaxID=2153361 RepID=UPI000F562141|nr:hypothetical protein [Paucibacter sp. KBW04]RQO56365.1 hypothetical protein DBR47_17745 [Paucibacter sp. KBW04]
MTLPLKTLTTGLLVLSLYGLWLASAGEGEGAQATENTKPAPAIAQQTAVSDPVAPTAPHASPSVPASSHPDTEPEVAGARSALTSENYAELIRQAAESKDPKDWLAAAKRIANCRWVPRQLDFVHSYKAEQAPGSFNEEITTLEAEARACQILGSQHLALELDLLRRALEQRAPGAALSLATALGSKPAPADKALALQGLRSDARSAHIDSLNFLAAFGDLRFNLTDVARRSYVLVLQALGTPNKPLLKHHFAEVLPSAIAKGLPAQQEAAAAEQARLILSQ